VAVDGAAGGAAIQASRRAAASLCIASSTEPGRQLVPTRDSLAHRASSALRTHATQRSSAPRTCSLVAESGGQYGVSSPCLRLRIIRYSPSRW
jgi:hypothetical protein